MTGQPRPGGFEVKDPYLAGQPEPNDGTIIQLSAEARFDRVRVAAEWEHFKPGAFDVEAWYVSAGIRTFGQLWLNAQAEVADMTVGPLELDYARDYALGLSYAVSPQVVLKLEGHEVEGYQLDAPVNVMGPPQETRYYIASISTAF